MDLSIIIAHYDPGDSLKCIESFHKTLSKIESQKGNYKIEVIIADDGSKSHEDIQHLVPPLLDHDERYFYNLKGTLLENWKKKMGFNYPSISNWLYLPKNNPMMSKARIGNAAITTSLSTNLFFLDDDNYFISDNTIHTIITLLKKYSFVVGQIQDNNRRFRSYSSNRVQGTTFGIIKNHLIEAGSFGEWTEEISCGIDSDLWWKLYFYFKKNPTLKACYTSDIQTLDSCSKRWKIHINTFFRNYTLKKIFKRVHGCNNYRNIIKNPSRNKSKWIINLS